MGYMPVPKLLFSMALPMILSMLVQALYNIVDSVFVSRITENALTAVSLAFPMQNLMISVASGTAVGINALLSRSLGAGDRKNVTLSALNGIFLELMSFVVFALIGLFGSRLFFLSQTSDPEIVSYGTQYMTIVLVCSFGMFMQFAFERLLQSTGRTFFTMITQGTGAIINIILDPILIFGFFGLPKMGVAGAAVATVIGQIIAACLALYFNLTKNTDIRLNFRGFRPNLETIKNIYKVGIPSIIMMSIGSVMTFAMNKILLMFSSTAAAVFGVYFKLQSFVFMPVFGLNNGMVPIIAFNYGARNRKRIMDTVKLSVIFAVSIMVLGFAVFQLIPDVLLSLFNASPDMLQIGVPALRTISYSFLFAGYCICVGSVFQALGNGIYSLIVSVARQLVFLVPLAYLFAKLWGLNAVWWSFPLAELVSLGTTTFFFIKIYRERIKPLG
ncbi:MAG: MATE family efflux transporter [Eubacteriales bacterium]|nr:MATE family efflux transporter [Eubacteriales bacterium]